MNENNTGIVKMPMIALRGLVILPNTTIHFDVGRKKNIAAIEVAIKNNSQIFLVTQCNMKDDNFDINGIFQIGTIARIKQVLKLPGDNIRVLVEGEMRGRIVELATGRSFYQATVEPIDEPYRGDELAAEAVIREAQLTFDEYADYAPKVSPDIIAEIVDGENPGHIADFITANINIKYVLKQKILETIDPVERLKELIKILYGEIEIMSCEQQIRSQVRDQMDHNQKEYYLREQLKAIQSELGEGESFADEIEEYREKIHSLNLPKEHNDVLLKEVSRLQKMSSGSAEAGVIRTYLDTCLELPWNKLTKDKLDLVKVREVLDKDHYGMEKVKDRIIEFLAVKKLTDGKNSQIICLVGPPGVGKTSIAISIAKAFGRKSARIALGGIRDEAEIRGHRKTYIGAMPGRIINALKYAKSRNPLILLDEIDKLTSDMRGDPSAALLEVLDSEQNFSFRDHYVELPFDLRDVMFITTANNKDTIPRPLLDRMEIIELTSYTDEEKRHIAENHLIPKQLKLHGLSKRDLKMSSDAVRATIELYTRESGVRTLERSIAGICRKAAVAKANGSKKTLSVTPENISEYLGAPKYKRDEFEHQNQVGITNGLAYTAVGGETMVIEVLVTEGTGKLVLTGSLGDVMKESCNAAISYIRSRAEILDIDKEFYKNTDIHIHFPEGAVPKDGPSAGAAITAALASALTSRPADGHIAMTGEVTLRGRILPIGGLKEKTMAALREGMKTVIVPDGNRADISEIDKDVRAGLSFKFVTHVDEVLDLVLLPKIEVNTEIGTALAIGEDNKADKFVPEDKIKGKAKTIRQ